MKKQRRLETGGTSKNDTGSRCIKRMFRFIYNQRASSENHNYNVIMTVDFAAVLQVAVAKDTDTKGILINPGTTKLILNPKLLDL